MSNTLFGVISKLKMDLAFNNHSFKYILQLDVILLFIHFDSVNMIK